MKLLAKVPYDVDKSYEFYNDRLVIEEAEYFYKDIDGYGFGLTHSSTSIYLVPVGNSSSYIFRLWIGDKMYGLNKSASNVMLFKNKKQRTIDMIFSELVQCVEAFIAPEVYKKNIDLYFEQGWINLGEITLRDGVLYKKGFFGTKELSLNEYGFTSIQQGTVNIYNSNKKLFYSCSLTEYNAPLIGVFLDALTGRFEEDG